jgi:hypothetical protein
MKFQKPMYLLFAGLMVSCAVTVPNKLPAIPGMVSIAGIEG